MPDLSHAALAATTIAIVGGVLVVWFWTETAVGRVAAYVRNRRRTGGGR